MLSVKEKSATSTSSKSAKVDPVKVLIQLTAVALFAIVAAYLLSIQGTSFFKLYVSAIDVKNPIGFIVILFLAVLCQVLIWSVPAMIAGSLTRTAIRTIGAWFDFSLRMVLVVLSSLLFDIGLGKLMLGEEFPSSERFQRVLLRAFARLHDMLTVRLVEHIRIENVLFSAQLIMAITYIVFLIFVVSHIKRIFLPTKMINYFYAGILLLSVSLVTSFLFFVFDPSLTEVWTKPIFYNSFWIIDNRISLISIMRTAAFWVDILFVVLILQVTCVDRDDTVREVAAPSFAKFD
jgi:hypothetical protein